MQKVNSQLKIIASEELEKEVEQELKKAKANKFSETDIKYLIEAKRAQRSNRETDT